MAEGRSKAFVKNTIATALYQSALIISSFLVPRYVIENYGSETNGLVTSLTQFLSYFTIVEAGISGAAIFAIYRPLSENAWGKVSGIISAARRYYLVSGAIFLSLVLILGIVYPKVVVIDGLTNLQVGLLVVALGTAGCLDFFTLAKYRTLLTADKRVWVIQVASTVYVALNTLIIVSLATYGANIVVIYCVAVLPAFVRVALLRVYSHRRYQEVDYYADSKGVVLHQRWDAFFLQVQAAIQDGAPIVIATIMLRDLTLLSVFSIYLTIAMGCQRIANMLGAGLQASFGELLIEGKQKLLQRAFLEYELIVHGATVIICGVALGVIMPFIDLYTRDITTDNYYYPILGTLIILNVFLYQVKTPQGLMVISAGLFRETRWRTLIQSITLIFFGTLLSVSFGFYGIMFGVMASNVYRIVDLYFFSSRFITKIKIRSSYVRLSLSTIQMLIIAGPVIALYPTESTWLSWIITSALGTVWALIVVVVFAVLFSKSEVQRIRARVKNLIAPSGKRR